MKRREFSKMATAGLFGIGLSPALLTSSKSASDNYKNGLSGVEFFVSPKGDDTNSGTLENPFKTLEKARDEVRKINASLQQDIFVNLMEGEYELEASLILTELDSGFNGHSVIYRSYDGIGKARISGGHAVTGWTEEGDGVWKAEVGAGRIFHTLYDNGRRVRKARFPKYVHQERFPTADSPYLVSTDGSQLGAEVSWVKYAEGDLDPDKLDVGTLKINVWPWGKCNWHRWICKVTEIDKENRIIYFDNMGDKTEIKALARFFLEDHRPLLSAPGEFFLDHAEGFLYYMPMDGGDPNSNLIVYPLLHSLIRLEGSRPDLPVQNVVFDGLLMANSDGYAPTLHAWTYAWGLNDDALFYLNNTKGITIIRCHLRNSGRNGILMPGANRHNRVESCLIQHIGVNGITLSCPGIPRDIFSQPVPNEHNIITNNRINNVGELSIYAECIGVFNSSRNEITHCNLYQSPRYAITMRGNSFGDETKQEFNNNKLPSTNNLYAHLRIYDCGQDSGDMGAVHACIVNIPDGPYQNVYEQITVQHIHAVEGMNDWSPDGIFLDWPKLTMHQIFRHIHIIDAAGRQLRSNGLDNGLSAVTENVSWEKEFDMSKMEYSSIGVKSDYPVEFGGQREEEVPQTPEDLVPQVEDDKNVHLSWSPVPDHPWRNTFYYVFRDGVLAGMTTETEFNDTDLQESAEYLYQVQAFWLIGSESLPGAGVKVETLQDVTPPSLVAVMTDSIGDRIVISFDEAVEKISAESAENYEIIPSAQIRKITHLSSQPHLVIVDLATPLSTDQTCELVVRNIRDRAKVPNELTEGRKTFKVSEGLMAHYPLDTAEEDQVPDISGNNLHGLMFGGCSWVNGGGVAGDALQFPLGTEAHVKLPKSLNFYNNDFTIAIWINKYNTNSSIIASKGNGFGSVNQWSLGWAYPEVNMNVSLRSNNNYYPTAPDSIPAKEWLHVAFVRQGNTGYTYVNGKPSGGPHQLLLGNLFNDHPLMLGRRVWEATPFWFSGLMDDLRIYQRALSPAEIELICDLPGDWRNIDEVVSAGSVISDKKMFKIFPNPASGYLIIDLSASLEGSLSIISLIRIDGVKVAEIETRKTTYHFDIGSYKPGVYFVSLRNGRKYYSEKLIIR